LGWERWATSGGLPVAIDTATGDAIYHTCWAGSAGPPQGGLPVAIDTATGQIFYSRGGSILPAAQCGVFSPLATHLLLLYQTCQPVLHLLFYGLLSVNSDL
jgi:hypothetical protein